MDLIHFLGRFHVLVLHLPIGIILIVAVLDWRSRKERFRGLAPAADFLWAAAALTAVATVVLGFMHFSEGGFEGRSAHLHRFFGTTVAVLSVLIWLFRRRSLPAYQRLQPYTTGLMLAVVTLTGHYGGNLTHGPTYLVEFAPESLKRLAGQEVAARKIASMNEADVFADLIQPIFRQRCASCHNADKKRGGLDLSSHALVMKGGEKGVVVVAGKPDASDLMRRISLPVGADEAMPAEGKPALSEAQVSLIRWWIAAGAPRQGLFTAFMADEQIRRAASETLGFTANPSGPAPAKGAVAAVDQRVLDTLIQAGFTVRQLSANDVRLTVARTSLAPMSAEELRTLASAGCSIAEVNVARSGLGDAELAALGGLTCLKRLNVANNRITDLGLEHLGKLSELEVLNVYGNERITETGLSRLRALQKLRTIYAWNTGVTVAAAASVHRAAPSLSVDVGIDPGRP